MQNQQANVIICGAGIAGVSAAYHLAVKRGVANVVLVDERPPLTLTSDKSSECYRNWWPGPGTAMVALMNRSLDLLEALADESGNFFHMNRRGYLYLSQDAAQMETAAAQVSALGAGELRVHDGRFAPTYQPPQAHGYQQAPTGADLLLGSDLIRQQFPFITTEVAAALHVRRAGWLSAQQFGMYLWEQARAHGARLVTGTVVDVGLVNGRFADVTVQSGTESFRITAPQFVDAAGPMLKPVAAHFGVALPVVNEKHGKIAFEDPLGVIPRSAPMIINQDPIYLPWVAEERAFFAEAEETRWLTEVFPGGAHFRPEGGPGSETLLFVWNFHTETVDPPTWPLRFGDEYAEVVLRGVSRAAPGLSAYFERMSKPELDGGYYTKTRENRPLIGPLPVAGTYVIGALSGYGIMAAMGAGDLLAAHVTGGALPAYAPAFTLSRYDDPAYQALLAEWDTGAGQL